MSIIRPMAATNLAAFIFLIICCDPAWACQACGHSAPCVQNWTSVEVEEQYVVKVPYTEEVERTVNVSVPHMEQEEQTYTAMVPHSEVKTGTKIVRTSIPDTKTVTVSRDFGRWETPVREEVAPCDRVVGCGCRRHRGACSCGHCAACCHQEVACDCPDSQTDDCRPVWIADVRTKEIAVTTYRVVSEEVPYEYTVTVYRPEERTRTVDVVRYTTEERTQKRSVLRYREETRVRKVCVLQPTFECCPAAQ